MIPKSANKFWIFMVNFLLMIVGIFLIKNKEQKNQEALKTTAGDAESKQALAKKAAELQSLIDQIRETKLDYIANNSAQTTIKEPTTVTEVIPGTTSTIKVPSGSTSSKTSSSSSTKTTKTS